MRLTRDEIILVTCILVALATGALVKHWRESERVAAIQHARPAESAKAGIED